MLRPGFVGLGNIGAPIAERLVKGSLEPTVYDLDASAVEVLARSGATPASSIAELAAGCNVIGVCVRDDADIRRVCLGSDGLIEAATPGTVIALHSTILPSTVLDVARAASERGVGVIDACITGGRAGAEQGTLTYIVGGEEKLLERCRPAFETSAARIVHTGKLGSGAATKLCNNLMTYLGFLAGFEATLLARSSGLSQDALEEVTRSNGNMSAQILAFLALHKLPEEKRREEGFQAVVRSFADLGEKDLAVTLAFARENGVALPGTALAQQLMARIYGVEDGRRR